MFYVTFVKNYFGLSRDGIVIDSKYGFGVPLTNFDTYTKEYISKSNYNALEKKQSAHVLWYDNFSKFHAHSVPTLRKDVFSSCLWTGVTINEYIGPEVNMDVKFNNNSVVPAMPVNILDQQATVHRWVMSMYGLGKEYYDESMVKKYNINNIPLKINLKRYPNLKPHIATDINTMRYIHPEKLIQKNIGSNRGLNTILKDLEQEHKMHRPNQCKRYLALNLDENIYYRTLKVYMHLASFFCVILYTSLS